MELTLDAILESYVNRSLQASSYGTRLFTFRTFELSLKMLFSSKTPGMEKCKGYVVHFLQTCMEDPASAPNLVSECPTQLNVSGIRVVLMMQLVTSGVWLALACSWCDSFELKHMRRIETIAFIYLLTWLFTCAHIHLSHSKRLRLTDSQHRRVCERIWHTVPGLAALVACAQQTRRRRRAICRLGRFRSLLNSRVD
jgi:hypothetical protein